MTSGTKIDDQTYFNDTLGFRVGTHVKKIWSGADDPINHKAINSWTAIYQKGEFAGYLLYDDQGNIVFSGQVGGFGSGGFCDTPEWGPNEQAKAIAGIGANIRGHEANMSKMLAEANDSMDLIRDTAKILARGIMCMRRGNFSGAARALGLKPGKKLVGSAANAWLQLQYGWLPMLGDAYDAAEAFASLQSPPTTNHYSGSAAVYAEAKGDNNGLGFFQTAKFSRTYNVGHETSDSPSNKGSTLEDIARLHLDDPLGVLWEISPFSFLIDWFLPIGTYLEASNTLQVFKLTSGYTTSKWQRKTVPYVPQGTPAVITGPASSSEVVYGRSMLTDLTLQSPVIKPIGSIMNRHHCMNAIALLCANTKSLT